MTVDYKGAKTVHIRTTDNDKNRFICVLAALGDAQNFLPWSYLKVKDYRRGITHQGWMDDGKLNDRLVRYCLGTKS